MLASQDILVAVSFVANRRWLIAVVQTIAVHMKHQTTRQLSSLLSHLTSRIHPSYPTYGPVSYDSGSRPSYYSSYTPPSQPSLSLGEIIGITFGSIICLLIVGLLIGLIIIAFVTYKRRRLEYDTAAIALTVLQYQQREVTKVAPTREFVQEMPVMNTTTVLPTRPKPLPRAYAPVTASAVVVSSAPDTTSNRESGVYKLINICETK